MHLNPNFVGLLALSSMASALPSAGDTIVDTSLTHVHLEARQRQYSCIGVDPADQVQCLEDLIKIREKEDSGCNVWGKHNFFVYSVPHTK